MGVTAQAVSKWENGHNLPDIDNLTRIAHLLKVPYTALVDGEDLPVDVQQRNRLFHEGNMYTRVKTIAQTMRLENTLRALQFMRQMHTGQFRKGNRYATERVEYINHPLMMVCQALSMGINDDDILSALLLHDVVEDTRAELEELPVSCHAKKLVGLMTKDKGSADKETAKERYYKELAGCPEAALIKCFDRVNNLSNMALGFTRDKMKAYVEETEKYIVPLFRVIKDNAPEYSDAAWLLSYHMYSLLETYKRLLWEEA